MSGRKGLSRLIKESPSCLQYRGKNRTKKKDKYYPENAGVKGEKQVHQKGKTSQIAEERKNRFFNERPPPGNLKGRKGPPQSAKKRREIRKTDSHAELKESPTVHCPESERGNSPKGRCIFARKEGRSSADLRKNLSRWAKENSVFRGERGGRERAIQVVGTRKTLPKAERDLKGKQGGDQTPEKGKRSWLKFQDTLTKKKTECKLLEKKW